MAKKRDYVLEKALKGDLEAIENIIGQVYAPLFDLSYHVFGSIAEARPPLVCGLEVLGRQLAAGALDGTSPSLVASRALILEMEKAAPAILEDQAPLLAGLEREPALALLGRCALDLDAAELDELLSCAPGRGEKLAEEGLARLAVDVDEFRDRLDEVSAGVALPEGLVDEVLARLEED